MDAHLRKKLTSSTYEEPYEAISYILSGNVSPEILHFVLSLEDTLVISAFLDQFSEMTDELTPIFNDFVKNSLISEDDLFVSDVIEFANYWMIDIFEDCLYLIENPKKDPNVILSAINFIYENLDFGRIEEVFEIFISIKENNQYYQNAQLTALFFLYRFSHNDEYLHELIELVEKGQDLNKQVLLGILSWNYNQPEYFRPYEKLIKLCS